MPSRDQAEVARRGLAVVRSMRGAAGKLAQLADFVDSAWAPAGPERERLERELADLRAGTPEPLPAKRVERLLRDAWGGRVSEHLSDLDPEPVAMASAGQVHRGEARGGRPVAVKILHPGIEDALRADLGNVTLLAQLASTVLPGLDARGIAAELRDRALEEMDLEHEAQVQRTFARAYRGHPFVHVPAPLTELCHPEVLVSEWVQGTEFGDVVALPQAARNRYAEILVRFHTGSMLHLGAFHADPHPGNHRLLADGRVAFVDFGATGRAEPVWLAAILDAVDAAADEDADRVKRDLADLGYLAEPERVDSEQLLERIVAAGSWVLDTDAEVRIDAAFTETLVRRQLADTTALEELLPFARVPARDLQAGRMLSGLGAVLARLRASARWGAIAAEHRHGTTPVTALGKEEHAFWASRGHSRGAAVQELRRAA